MGKGAVTKSKSKVKFKSRRKCTEIRKYKNNLKRSGGKPNAGPVNLLTSFPANIPGPVDHVLNESVVNDVGLE